MNSFYHFFESVEGFMYRGGWVLYLIFLTIFIMWFLIIERFWYFRFKLKKEVKNLLFDKWSKEIPVKDAPSYLLLKIWKSDVSVINILLNKNIATIKALTKLCPLMGLLGTVTGMIAVFEVMANIGTGNARLMASGVSMATIPTMAGMVGALSGLYITRILENRISSYLGNIKQLVFEK